VSAWLFGLELSVVPFSRRGLPLAARRHLLGRRRAMAFGFALPAYLLCLVRCCHRRDAAATARRTLLATLRKTGTDSFLTRPSESGKPFPRLG